MYGRKEKENGEETKERMYGVAEGGMDGWRKKGSRRAVGRDRYKDGWNNGQPDRRKQGTPGRHDRLLNTFLPIGWPENVADLLASAALPTFVEARLLFFRGDFSTFLD